MTTETTQNEPQLDEEVEAFIRQNFEQNYARLQLDGGHALTPYVKEAAFRQVQMYWRRLHEIANSVTDTEVRLTLPEQTSLKGRKYTIEGVVDIIREDDRTVMYDIKTHDPDDVRSRLDAYQRQLNVYAHIWQGLRGQPLDETAIIATAFPAALREAYRRKDQRRIEQELERWEPVVNIPMEQEKVDETIRDFGAIVDRIEDKQFAPPPVETLKTRCESSRDLFATRVCRNCDARFSCASYRRYAISTNSKKDFNFSEYFADFDPSDQEKMERITVTLDANPDLD
jgi:hypothetical protein